MKRNILQYLEDTAARVPQKCAFADDREALTFAEVSGQARAIGSFLCHQGFYKQPVVVFMKRRPATIAAFLGVLYGGCYYVPMDEEMPRNRMERILTSLEPGAILCEEDTEALALEIAGSHRVLRHADALACAPDDAALADLRDRQIDTDPTYIVFTSGSTGVPKGVIGCHRAVIDYIENLCDVLKFDETTVFGNQSPLYFDACLKEIVPTLKYGATVWLIPKQLFMFPVKLVEYLNDHRINTVCWVVPALTMISGFHTFDTVVPQYLRTVAFASEVFPIRQFNLWKKALPETRFVNLYGPTETTGICCYYEVDREFSEDESLPVGRPFPNTEILLLDENNQIPAPGCQGEICIRGTRLTLGYYRNPQKTEEAFVQNPLNSLYPERIYRTGDLGCYNDRGELMFLSRKDYQIKHMGHRIELGEIEAAANRIPGIQSACCIFDGEKKRIVLFYAGEIAVRELTAGLREELPRYMLPNRIQKLPALPLTPNGKLDRKRLAEQAR